jgi:olfactory receptor
VYILFLAAAWSLGIIHSLFQLAFLINLPFCGPNVLDSFYYDLPRLLRLACADTYKLQFMVTVNSGFICVGSFLVLLMSYVFIPFTVWKHASGGSSKALSNLSAHITVVILFFDPTLFVYTWPHPNSQMDKFLALSDAVLTPFLNPVIYTFRNKEMKAAITRIFKPLMMFIKIS